MPARPVATVLLAAALAGPAAVAPAALGLVPATAATPALSAAGAAPRAAAAAKAARPTTARTRASRRARRTARTRISFGRAVGGLGAFAGLTRTAPGAAAAPAPATPGAPAPLLPVLPDPLAGALTPAATAAPAPATPAPDPATNAPAAGGTTATLGVQVDETPAYAMVLSKATVPAGSVRIQLLNTGEDAHNALLTRTDGGAEAIVFPLTEPGRTTTRTVTLAPGSYRLVCTLTTPVVHESAGMRAGLTVSP